jgi:GNAT superfamily N-acetyltransferase
MPIRSVKPGDEAICVALLRELAVFERKEAEFVMTPDRLAEILFGPDALMHALLAETEGGEAVGYAFYYWSVSTFFGKRRLHLEDLYTTPAVRGHGVGLALLEALKNLASQRDAQHVEWHVLDWNADAIGFYETRLGATRDNEWLRYIWPLSGSAS